MLIARAIFLNPGISSNRRMRMKQENRNRKIKLTCRTVQAGQELVSKQAHFRAPGISVDSVGAQKISLQIVRIPPGERAKAHKHEGHESAIYVLSGDSGMWYGEKLEEHLTAHCRGLSLHSCRDAASALQSEQNRELRCSGRSHRPE